jgi:hypothetical protein
VYDFKELKEWHIICCQTKDTDNNTIYKEVHFNMTATGQPSLYASAAFRLESPGILFQFKLRRTETEPLFALVHKNSRALARLKEGTLVPMTFYYPDKTIPPVKIETRIKYIRSTGSSGLSNHVIIALDIDEVNES